MSQKGLIYNMNMEDIDKKIEDYLPVRIRNKYKLGEVFTPPSIINDMLDTLPKSVWSNPNLKWLDPANGIGNFPMLIFHRLNKGLKDKIKNEAKRKKHIIKNMLFMVELNPKNVKLSQLIFGTDANIFHADFLKQTEKWKNDVNKVKFDIIVGNPPYNAEGTKHKGQKNLYVDFVVDSFDILNKNGYLLFVHPPTWRIPNHKIQHTGVNLNEIYTGKQLLAVKMYSVDQVLKLMNVMINVDFILVKNTPNNNTKTKIINTKNEVSDINIERGDFIPNYGSGIMNKLQMMAKKNGHMKMNLTSENHAQQIKKGSHPNIHGITHKGIKVCYSKNKHSEQNTPKVIINGIGSHNYVYHDKQGKYGLTQSPMSILKPTQGDMVLLNSKLFHYITNATKIIGNNLNKQTEQFLPIIPNKIKTEVELYKYLGLSKQEKNDINKVDIPQYTEKTLSCDKRSTRNKTLKKSKNMSNKCPKTSKKKKKSTRKQKSRFLGFSF